MDKNSALKYIAKTFIRHLKERNQAEEDRNWSIFQQASGFCIGVHSTVGRMASIDEDFRQLDDFFDKLWELCKV
jgi:hypothetical protein